MSTAEQLSLGFEPRAATGAEDFLPASCNREALAWIARWPDWPAPVLVVHGPPGCGKTHLARIWADRVGVRPLDPLTLTTDPADHPGRGYVLDPAEPVTDELALLRFYNRLKEAGGFALLTAHRPAAAWPLGLADLASRLRAAPSVAIGAPDDALLGALLIKHFSDRQLEVSAALVAYLVRRMERSFAEARRLVAALDALSLQRRRPITVTLARRLVEQISEDQI